MTFHTSAQFEHLRRNLEGLLVTTTARFAEQAGLDPVRKASLAQMSTGLDETANQLLMFGCNAWPEAARTEEEASFAVEGAPSEVDPPSRALFWVGAVLLASVTVSMVMYLTFGVGDYMSLAVGIMAISMIFGSHYGILATILGHALHNFTMIPPALTFTMPTQMEICMALISTGIAIAAPWLCRHAGTLRRWAFATPLFPLAF